MKLFQHQIEALERTKGLNRVAYYLDMGLGKTFVGSEKAISFPEKILVICQKSKIQDWVEHFQTNYDLPVYDCTVKDQLNTFFLRDEKSVGVINYDLVYRRDYFLKLKNFTMMLDESSIIQNEMAKRSKFILRMKPNNVILLSGTPTSGKYEKFWSQLKLLGWTISRNLFYEQYVITDIAGNRMSLGELFARCHNELERLRAEERTREIAARRSRGEYSARQYPRVPLIPPAAAGDCAAPKLLQYAFENGYTPLALAEFWLGASNVVAGRESMHFYGACRGKCYPILTYMLHLPLDIEMESGLVEI